MSNKYTVWERPGVVEALKAAAAPGIYTAFELAALLSQRFDCDISRNAVMGKCWRLNIPLRGRTAPKPKAVKPNKPLAVIQQYLKAPRVKRSTLLKCDEPEPKPRGDVDDGCRFMHGSALERLFCGAQKAVGSWCEYHAAVVFSQTSKEVPSGNSKRAA